MIYVLSSLVPIAGRSNLFDRYAMTSVMICVIGIFLVGWDGIEPIYVHLALSTALHIYVLISMIQGYLNARKKVSCGFDESIKYLQSEPKTYSLGDESMYESIPDV